MAQGEGRFLKVGKNPITSFSLRVGNVVAEFDSATGLITYNRKMSSLVINGQVFMGQAPEEGDNGEDEEPEPAKPRKNGKRGKQEEKPEETPVTE